MKRISSLYIILLISSVLYAGSKALPWIELNVLPSVETKTDSQIRLLPTETELIEGDAFPLYEKAIKSLPQYYPKQKFSDWHSLPSDQLPIQEVESEIAKLRPTLELISQAAKCKECNWPKLTLKQAQAPTTTYDLGKLREIAFILEAQTNIQIAQRQYKNALVTIKKSLTMSNQVGRAPILTQGLVAIAMTTLNLHSIEQLIQSENAPNLYEALRNLPRPFVDIEKAIKYETDNFKDTNPLRRLLFRNQTQQQLKAAHDNTRKQMNYLDRKIAALQIIEALRLYAGKHKGQFPQKLSDITNVEIPNDPVTQKQFEYKSTGTEATIQIEGTEGSEGRDSVKYKLNLRK